VVLLLWLIVAAAAIFLGAASAGTVVRRVELETRTIRRLGSLALAMNLVLVVIFVGVLTWWAATAANAPWFFSRDPRCFVRGRSYCADVVAERLHGRWFDEPRRANRAGRH